MLCFWQAPLINSSRTTQLPDPTPSRILLETFKRDSLWVACLFGFYYNCLTSNLFFFLNHCFVPVCFTRKTFLYRVWFLFNEGTLPNTKKSHATCILQHAPFFSNHIIRLSLGSSLCPPSLLPGGLVSCFISGPCHCAHLSADDWHEGLGNPQGPVGSGWKKGEHSAYIEHWLNRTCTLDLTSAPLRHIYNDLSWT